LTAAAEFVGRAISSIWTSKVTGRSATWHPKRTPAVKTLFSSGRRRPSAPL